MREKLKKIQMACILLIESSTQVCSVAVSNDAKLLWNQENMESFSHSAVLGSFISEAMTFIKENSLRLDAVAVSKGPGSYTGLRIGVSLAKGLCYGLDIPLIALSSLKVMASQFAPSSSYLCPMFDARRMEVYTALFDGNLNEIEPAKSMVIDEDSFQNILSDKKIIFFGNGVEKCKAVIKSINANFLSNIYPLATNMIIEAENAIFEKTFVDIAYFEPYYLKDFQATTPKNKIFSFMNKE